MAKMYGNWRGSNQNSKGWTKRAKRHDEERQWQRDAASEEIIPGECPHVASTREDVEGLKACASCVYDQSLYVEGVPYNG